MEPRLEAKINSIEASILDLTEIVKDGFARFEARFDGVDKRFDGVDKRFSGVDKRFEGMDKRFSELEYRLSARMEKGFEAIELRLRRLERGRPQPGR